MYQELKNRLFNQREAKVSFRKLKKIGSHGVNSEVFRAIDSQLNTEIAAKQVPNQYFINEESYFEEARIFYEAAHPNVVELMYACKDEKNVYIAMPYFKRGNLSKVLSESTHTLREILSYAFDFLTGLHFMHSHGILHLDVKPGNILITDSNRAVISDFGLSRHVSKVVVKAEHGFYFVHMPPESLSQKSKLEFTTDIYQAGVTLYRMVNGDHMVKQQFLDSTKNSDGKYSQEVYENAVQLGKYPDRRAYLPHVPRKLKRIINKAMNVRPQDRYTSVLDLLNDLARVTEQLNIKYSYIQEEEQPQQVWSIATPKYTDIITLSHHNDGMCTLLAQRQNKKTINREILNLEGISDEKMNLKQAFQVLQHIFVMHYS